MPNKSQILVVTCQPTEVRLKYSMLPDTERIAKILGWPNTKRLRAISAITEPLPATFPEAGVIICGSRHAVYEDLPWIRAAKEFVRQVYAQGKPMLGICFGQQLIVSALGGEVKKGQIPEKGMVDVTLTNDGKTDPLFTGLDSRLHVGTHHGDSVILLPDIADIRLLGTNNNDKYQALAIGNKVRTTAFHADMYAADIVNVLQTNKDSLLESGYFKNESELNQHIKQIKRSSIDKSNHKILNNFVSYFVS